MNPEANCKIRDIVYQISCLGSEEDGPCGESYIGESARSLKERINEHVEKYEKKDKNSVLFKHMEEKHGGRRQQITVERLATCPATLLRQVSEAVYIQELLPTLNSIEEWGNSNIPRKRQNNNNRFLEDCDV